MDSVEQGHPGQEHPEPVHLDRPSSPADQRPGRRPPRWLLPAVAGVAVCAVVAVTGTITANANSAPGRGHAPAVAGAPGAGPAGPAAPAASLPADRAGTSASESRTGRPDPNPPEEDRTPVGEVIPAGTHVACGDPVLWLWRISDARPSGTTFALTAGCRTAKGDLKALVTTNETEGSDTAPGFHAVQGAMNVDGVPVPTFGYYAGPAATITATAGGRTVQAHRTPWSANPQVVVFWFDTTGDQTLTGLTARDAAGNQLPAGNTGIGVG